jgi:DNA-binding transcriptional regulator YiaG
VEQTIKIYNFSLLALTLRAKRSTIFTGGENVKAKYPKITLRAARINAGLTLEKAATGLGISISSLRNYELGRTVPSYRTVKQMEIVYEVSADYLFLSIDSA